MTENLPLGPEHISFLPGPTVPHVVRTEGSFLITADGRRILDAAGGAIVSNIGGGRREVAEVAAAASEAVAYVVPPWATDARVALRDRLITSWLPAGMHRVGFCSGGSEAADSALRLAIAHHAAAGRPQRWKIIGRTPSYHGATVGSLSMGGHNTRRAGFESVLLGFPHVQWDDPDALEQCIVAEGAETIAAFVAEPVIGAAGGVLIPADDYFPRVAEICKRHGVLLIIDEVMTGFGRMGTKFGIDRWGVVPDIMYGGKGIAGGYAALCGMYATDAVTEPIVAAGQQMMFFTFAGQSAACAVGDKVLQIMEDEDLVSRSAKMGDVLEALLHDALGNHPNVSAIRVCGLWAGIEIVAERDPRTWFPATTAMAGRVTAEALQRDVWVYPSGSGDIVRDAVMLGPAFTTSEDELDQMVNVLAASIDAAVAAAPLR